MAGLQVDVTSNAGVVSPVVDQTAGQGFQALGSLLAAFAPQPEAQATPSNIEGRARQSFYAAMARGQAQIDQGDAAAGRITQNTAYTEWARVGGMSDSDINDFFTNATGVSAGAFLTGDLIPASDIRNDETWNAQLALTAATNPEAESGQIEQMTAAAILQRKADEQAISNAQASNSVAWTSVRKNYINRVNDTTTSFRALVESMQEDHVITSDERDEVNRQFEAAIASLPAPQSATADEWKQFQDTYVEPLRALKDGVLSFNEGMTTAQQNEVSAYLTILVDKGELNPNIMKAFSDASGGATGGMDLLKQVLGDAGLSESYKSIYSMSLPELREFALSFDSTLPSDFPEPDLTEFTNMSESARVDAMAANATLLIAGGDPSTNFLHMMQTNEMVLSADGESINPTRLATMYGKRFTDALSSIYEANPEAARRVGETTINALNSQVANNEVRLESVARQNGFIINPNGSITVDTSTASEGVGSSGTLVKTALLQAKRSIGLGPNDTISGEQFAAILESDDVANLRDPNLSSIHTLRSRLLSIKSEAAKLADLKRLAGQVETSINDTLGVEQQGQQGGQPSQAPLNYTPTTAIIQFEGFRNSPYYDVNSWRAGYGSDTYTTKDGKFHKVQEGVQVSRADADRDIARRVNTEFIPNIISKVGQDVWNTQNSDQQAALTSITYNYGSLPSRLVQAVKSGDAQAVAEAIRGLGDDNGGVNRARRNAEADMYLSQGSGPDLRAPTGDTISESTLPPLPTDPQATREAGPQAQQQQGSSGGSSNNPARPPRRAPLTETQQASLAAAIQAAADKAPDGFDLSAFIEEVKASLAQQ